ncbi:MAG: hypothetical protein HC854_01865 [Flavobacterium sp.]|nr:hypothetical protein [Flavobacterium sp.]
MPLHRQYGFVFSDETRVGETKQTEGSRLATIIAHELGHGAFELEHPWEKFDYNKEAFSTNWLMDYASGAKLPYMHWQQISHPKTKLYLFQSDESGELAGGYAIAPDYSFISNGQEKTVAFLELAPKGFLGGFVKNSKNYKWDLADKLYVNENDSSDFVIPTKSSLIQIVKYIYFLIMMLL